MNTTVNQKNSVLALYPNMRGYGYAYLENEQTPVDCGISQYILFQMTSAWKALKS